MFILSLRSQICGGEKVKNSTFSKITGYFFLFSAFTINFMNWAWLMGIVQKPDQNLVEARIWYSIIAGFVGFILISIGEAV